jgi:hypothetical protein
METFLTGQKKPDSKVSQVLPNTFHLTDKLYSAHVRIGSHIETSEYFDSWDEAKLEQRCIEKRLSFEVIDTVEGEGYFPDCAKLIEEKYQASGRTNGLYTGLMLQDGTVSNNATD